MFIMDLLMARNILSYDGSEGKQQKKYNFHTPKPLKGIFEAIVYRILGTIKTNTMFDFLAKV